MLCFFPQVDPPSYTHERASDQHTTPAEAPHTASERAHSASTCRPLSTSARNTSADDRKMHVEVSVALNFIVSYLYNKLPRRRVDMFAEELEQGLKRKFDGHWYPDKPFRGSGFRCLRVSGEKMDPTVAAAVQMSGLDMTEVVAILPADLTLWIDPGEVSYRIGERGYVKVLYSYRRDPDETDAVVDAEIQNVGCTGSGINGCSGAGEGFNPEAQSFQPIDTLSSSLTSLRLSPSSSSPGARPVGTWRSPSPAAGSLPAPGSPAGFLGSRPAQMTTFTAATFAQTKFGSTKLKSQAKRPSRLSPTEFNGFPKQQRAASAAALQPWAATLQPRPHSLSPQDPRVDMFERQHRLLLQQQQQQHQQLQNAGLLSPLGGSLSDLYSHPAALNMGELLSTGNALSPLGVPCVPSPDANQKTLLDAVNWGNVPPYINLQHLLVAN